MTANLPQSDKPVRLSRQQARMLGFWRGMRNGEIAENGTVHPHDQEPYGGRLSQLDVHNAMDAVLKRRSWD